MIKRLANIIAAIIIGGCTGYLMASENPEIVITGICLMVLFLYITYPKEDG